MEMRIVVQEDASTSVLAERLIEASAPSSYLIRRSTLFRWRTRATRV